MSDIENVSTIESKRTAFLETVFFLGHIEHIFVEFLRIVGIFLDHLRFYYLNSQKYS